MLFNTRTTCRICGSKHFQSVLNFGNIFPSDFIKNTPIIDPVPLHLVRCTECNLVQLEHTVNQDLLYRQYWYQSGLNKSMVRSLQEIVTSIESLIELKDSDTVLDIGCNDGTLLSLYANKGLHKIGVDPAKNLAHMAKKVANEFYNDYFPVSDIDIKAKVITSIAMFYDLEDPNAFVSEIKKALLPGGMWVVQFTDLLSMLKVNAFDNIVHEHLEYYSFKVLYELFWKHDLQIFHVLRNDVNGASVRAYVCHKGDFAVQQSVIEMEVEEAAYLAETDQFYAFGERVRDIKHDLLKFLRSEKEAGKVIAVLGASTKGNTLLQFFNLDDSIISFAGEVNADKYGLKTVGTNIPIISEAEAISKTPDYFLVLPWHFKETFMSIIQDNPDYFKSAKLIFPLPQFTIL